MNANDFKTLLVSVISRHPVVLGIGQTGDLNAPLIPGRSDIDMFVVCDDVPGKEERMVLYEALRGTYDSLQMQVCAGGIWGYGDIFICEGIDVMPMYFRRDEMEAYLKEVLDGKHLEKEGRFYPVGRLASIETLNILWEKEKGWSALTEMVKARPDGFFDKWLHSEIGRVVDEEDLGRSEIRHDVLFFHQVAEEFLDHFLQALFAINHRFFPSRKRMDQAIASFAIKPRDCTERLTSIVMNGAHPDTMGLAIQEIRALGAELKDLQKAERA